MAGACRKKAHVVKIPQTIPQPAIQTQSSGCRDWARVLAWFLLMGHVPEVRQKAALCRIEVFHFFDFNISSLLCNGFLMVVWW
jgi:hypothetical protein